MKKLFKKLAELRNCRWLVFCLLLSFSVINTAYGGAWVEVKRTVIDNMFSSMGYDDSIDYPLDVYRDVDWRFCFYQPNDGTVPGASFPLYINKHINPNVSLEPLNLVTRDTAGCYVSREFGNHQQDWDYLVNYRDSVFAAKGFTAATPTFDKVKALIDDLVENHPDISGSTYFHPVDTIIHGGDCGGNSNTMIALAHTMGLEARAICMNSHTMFEVKIDGKWCFGEPVFTSYVHLVHMNFIEICADPDSCTEITDSSQRERMRTRYDPGDPNSNIRYVYSGGRYWHFHYIGAYGFLRVEPETAKALYPECDTIPIINAASESNVLWTSHGNRGWRPYGQKKAIGQDEGVRTSFYVGSLTGVSQISSHLILQQGDRNFPADGGDWYVTFNGNKHYLSDLSWSWGTNYEMYWELAVDTLEFSLPLGEVLENSLNTIELRCDSSGSEYLAVRLYDGIVKPTPAFYYDPTGGDIVVTSPNGGETWTGGGAETVTWTTTGTVGNVKIELSTDGGSTWPYPLATDTLNDGTETVSVPDEDGTQCRVRVSETDGSPSDTSDADFTIIGTPKTITVTSPNGGEDWTGGGTETVTWTSSGPVGNVKIELSTDGGSTWTTLLASTSDDGMEDVSVPDTNSSQCRIRVSETDGSPNDMSDADFTITGTPEPKTIDVTYPVAGTTWTGGTTETVTWDYANITQNVDIYLTTDAGGTWDIILADTPCDGSEDITVPDTPNTLQSQIIVKTVDGTVEDWSNGWFTIVSGGPDTTPPAVSVTSIVIDGTATDAELNPPIVTVAGINLGQVATFSQEVTLTGGSITITAQDTTNTTTIILDVTVP